jgi:hypothetical protein
LRIDLARRTVVKGDRPVAEGGPITLDSNTGRFFGGEAEIVIDYPTQWLEEIGKWRHTADTRKTVKSARGVHKSSGR